MYDFKFLNNLMHNYAFYIGGFSGYTYLLDKKQNYTHVITNISMNEIIKTIPDLKVGMGESFDGLIELNHHQFLFYFQDNLESFYDLKNLSNSIFSFNLQGFFCAIQQNKFFDIYQLYYPKKKITPLYHEIHKDHLLEAICISLITNTPLELPDNIQISEKGSCFIFRIMVEELFYQGMIYQGFCLLKKYKLLDYYLPELNSLKGVFHDKDYHPEGDAYDHVFECLKYVESKNILLGWALILHDIGKSVALKYKKRRYDNHAQLGVAVSKKILERMGYTRDFINKILFLVEHHMHPLFIPYMNEYEKQDLINHPMFQELLQLFKLDIMGSHKNLNFYNRIKSSLWKDGVKVKNAFER